MDSNQGQTPIAEQHRLRAELRGLFYHGPRWAGHYSYAPAWDAAERCAYETQGYTRIPYGLRSGLPGADVLYGAPVGELECLAVQPTWEQRERAGIAAQLYRERMARCEYLGAVAPFQTDLEYGFCRFMIPVP